MPVKTNIVMKKMLLSLIAISFLFISCNNGSANSLENKDGNSTAVAETIAAGNSDTQTSGSGKPIHLTKQDFLEKVMNYEKNQTEWVYEGDKPALIDFYADWCGPCRMAAPVLEELAKEYEGQIHIYKIDTQKEKELAAVFGIQSIPAFLFVPTEGRPSMSSGIAQTPEATKEMFRQMIDEILLGKEPEESL
jgi:thioredoxin